MGPFRQGRGRRVLRGDNRAEGEMMTKSHGPKNESERHWVGISLANSRNRKKAQGWSTCSLHSIYLSTCVCHARGEKGPR